MTMRAKILEIKPEVHYDSTTYEQIVVIELSNGKKMGLFDYDMHTTPDMIGNSKDLIILAFLPKQVEKLTVIEPRIEPAPEKPADWKNHTFYGKIKKIGVADEWHEGEFKYKNLVLLNVGEGEILVDFDEETLKMVKEGDYIKISALRPDLLDIR